MTKYTYVFWSIVKARCKSKCIPTHMTLDNYTATSAADKASLFNKFFHSNFTQTMSYDEHPAIEVNVNSLLSNTELSFAEIHLILRTLNPNKAYGPYQSLEWSLNSVPLN